VNRKPLQPQTATPAIIGSPGRSGVPPLHQTMNKKLLKIRPAHVDRHRQIGKTPPPATSGHPIGRSDAKGLAVSRSTTRGKRGSLALASVSILSVPQPVRKTAGPRGAQGLERWKSIFYCGPPAGLPRWRTVGARLAHGWRTVGARLAHGWRTVGARLARGWRGQL
jgi:hypothetical protein